MTSTSISKLRILRQSKYLKSLRLSSEQTITTSRTTWGWTSRWTNFRTTSQSTSRMTKGLTILPKRFCSQRRTLIWRTDLTSLFKILPWNHSTHLTSLTSTITIRITMCCQSTSRASSGVTMMRSLRAIFLKWSSSIRILTNHRPRRMFKCWSRMSRLRILTRTRSQRGIIIWTKTVLLRTRVKAGNLMIILNLSFRKTLCLTRTSNTSIRKSRFTKTLDLQCRLVSPSSEPTATSTLTNL